MNIKSLTIRQPWAGAIFAAANPKDVENRRQAFTHRGPLLIHAGQQLAAPEAFAFVEQTTGVRLPVLGVPGAGTEWAVGAVVGVVNLASVHHWRDCRGSCSPWAQSDAVHLVLTDPQVLQRPVLAYGRQGMWTPDDDLIADVRKRLP